MKRKQNVVVGERRERLHYRLLTGINNKHAEVVGLEIMLMEENAEMFAPSPI